MQTARNICLEIHFHIQRKARINGIYEHKIIRRITTKHNKNKFERIARINNIK